MVKRLIILLSLVGAMVTFSSEGRADILWDWSFDTTEAGQFLTTGDFNGGTVAAGTYQLLDFSVSSTAAGGSNYEGSISDGTWGYFLGEGAATPYSLVWDGAAVSEWQNSGSTTIPEWTFQNVVGAGLKRYYFGIAIESYWDAWATPGADENDFVGPEWATLVAAEAYPPTPPGYYVAEGTLSVSPSGAAPIPEPSTMLLLGSGLAGLAAFRRRIRK